MSIQHAFAKKFPKSPKITENRRKNRAPQERSKMHQSMRLREKTSKQEITMPENARCRWIYAN